MPRFFITQLIDASEPARMNMLRSDLARNIALGFVLGVAGMFAFGGAQISDDGMFDAKAVTAKPNSDLSARLLYNR